MAMHGLVLGAHRLQGPSRDLQGSEVIHAWLAAAVEPAWYKCSVLCQAGAPQTCMEVESLQLYVESP